MAQDKINNDKNMLVSIRSYIKKQIESGGLPSIKEIAENFTISVQHLRVNHKKIFGHSLQRYITGERLAVAATLLRTTDYPINVIANRLDYDTNTFLRQFKRYYKLTPSDYRREHQER